ncbi:MAG: FAD-binding oxidoreductase, partial [Leucobacter sp.]|nr:FAD-binding oxidoreductase [Leucobacter sp.]
MMSREAVRRGYNKRNYVVGAHTPPGWAPATVETDQTTGSLQYDVVEVPDAVIAELREIAISV